MPKVTQQENGRVILNSRTLDAETHIFDFCANQGGASGTIHDPPPLL